MAGISSMGVGSGIDIRNIVDQLLAAERAPTQKRLDRKEATYQAELSAFGSVKSSLAAFKTAVEKLTDASSFRAAKGISGNSEAIEVTGADTVERAASFGIQVNALAQAQSLATAAFAGTAADVGAGSITFRFGTVATDENGAVTGFTQNAARATATIEIPAGSSSLTDVRDAVNAAEIGVRASVINDGTGERLVFSATDTGAANGFLVDVTDADGNLGDGAGLSRLQFNETAADQQHNRAGLDASLVVDGLSVTRPGNEITDLLEGATLNLRSTTELPVDVRVEPDVSKAKGLIEGFVKAYNELHKQLEAVSGYDAETEQGGVLQGNSLVRSVEFNMRRLITQQLPVLEGQSVRALADIGITTTREGTLDIDDAKLSERLADSIDQVGALFGTDGLVEGSGFAFESARTETGTGSYAVSVTQLAEQAAIVGAGVTPSPGAPVTIDGDNDELELTINGTASGRITLTQGSYTSGDALAAELQARINGAQAFRDAGIAITVEFAAGEFTLRTAESGSEANLEVTFADTNVAGTLGLSVGQTGAGVDVAGAIGGVPAEGFGRYLTAQTGAASGLKLEITGTQTGDLGTVRFSRGVSSLLEQTIDSFLDSDGPFTSTTTSLKNRIDDIADDRLDLEDRLARLETRLVAQFSAMDAMVAQLNQTSTFLTSQLAGLESLARNGGKKSNA